MPEKFVCDECDPPREHGKLGARTRVLELVDAIRGELS